MGDERLLGWELTHALGADPSFPEKFVATLRNSGDEEAMFYEPVSPELATLQEFELKKAGGRKIKVTLLVGGPRSTYRRKKTEIFRKAGGLDPFFAGTGSQNIPKLRYETRRRHGMADGEDFWRQAFEHEKKVFMGSEDGSRIYGDWHLLSAAAAMDAASPEVANEALEWVAYYLAMCKLFEVDGEIFWPGQRSAGHPTKPGLREWIYARAMEGDVRRAEGWCKESGVGLAFRWEKFATEELQANLDKAAARARELTRADLEARGRMAPIRILKSADGGLAVWIERGASGFSCVNPNTPPVVAAIRYTDQDPRWIPANGGGKRVRQQFDHCFVERTGDTLTYESDLFPAEKADLPPGPYELDMTIGQAG